MKITKNRILYYCDIVSRCVVHYQGKTEKGTAFKVCSHIQPSTCSTCERYICSLKILEETNEG